MDQVGPGPTIYFVTQGPIKAGPYQIQKRDYTPDVLNQPSRAPRPRLFRHPWTSMSFIQHLENCQEGLELLIITRKNIFEKFSPGSTG